MNRVWALLGVRQVAEICSTQCLSPGVPVLSTLRCGREDCVLEKTTLRLIITWTGSLVRTQGREVLILLLVGIQAFLGVLLHTFPQLLIVSVPLRLLVFCNNLRPHPHGRVCLFAFFIWSSTSFEFNFVSNSLLNFQVLCTAMSNTLNVIPSSTQMKITNAKLC